MNVEIIAASKYVELVHQSISNNFRKFEIYRSFLSNIFMLIQLI